MLSFDEAMGRVTALVERFGRNLDAYKKGVYNEAQVRKEFIDPLFEALGWDVGNAQGYAEQYKEVVHEDTVKVGVSVKAPDYSFRIGGQRKFFLEAKKPAVNIKGDPSPAYQLRRYAWSAKLPLSILTDFEEFAVYDCRIKPKSTDGPSAGRILYLTFDSYPEKFKEIYDVFAKESVLRGSFDRYAEAKAGKRGTSEVDTEFLKAIEGWRLDLARDIAKRNGRLNIYELNYAVQQTIDRIVFLRIAEDRGVETFGSLQALMNGANVYRRLLALYDRADTKYNSGLFDFKADTLSHSLSIDDKVIRDIIDSLYYPKSPYEFSVIGAEILGNVYEQFLGKVIRLTTGHQAKVEDKPEVKKAGGVYYTPGFVVDYIVKNTVGRWLEGKKPRQVDRLKVLDPACGSGSFLLRAYQSLLDWHRDWYVAEGAEKYARGKTPALYQGHRGEWRLTTAEKKRILTNNIFGVDIDRQAVEVTKLSLLLKVMEGENEETLKQLNLYGERALPSLEGNIKCGNSLIGPDFYEGRTPDMFGEEDIRRINAFDWQKEFPAIMKDGGFDCVIGNPPYGASFGNYEKDYLKFEYSSYKYKFDSYIYFIEKAIDLSNEGGYISFITPELWLKLESGSLLRKIISDNTGFERLKIYGEKVFAKSIVNTVVFLLRKGISFDDLIIESNNDTWNIPSISWKTASMCVIDYRLKSGTKSLVSKIKSASEILQAYGEAIQGITAYDKYVGQKEELIKSRAYHYDHKYDESCGKWLSGKDVTRYHLSWSGEWLRYGNWLAAPREPKFFKGPRLLFREVPGKGKRIQATIANETAYHGHSITPFKLNESSLLDIRFLLGIVNSKLISWYGGLVLSNFGKEIFPKLNPQDIKALPIRPIDFNNKEDVKKHDRTVSLVERMLELNKKAAAATTPADKELYKRQIDATDNEIDKLVYELYDLTEEEIKVVEGAQ